MNNKKYAVFTIDVEAFTDTECVNNSPTDIQDDLLDGLDEYIKILDQHSIKGTLFTVGELAPKISSRLKNYINQGHNLALHNLKHIAPMNQDIDEFKEDIKRAKENLKRIFSTDVIGFRAPCFSLDRNRLEVLRELGFKYDSSNLSFSKARHTVDLDLKDFKHLGDGIFSHNGFFEFGLSVQNIFGMPFPVSGGGYVRLGNWEFIKSLILQYIKNHNYYVFYLHPFELTKQKIPFIKDLKAYDKYYIKAGIKTYAKKIEYIIYLLKKCGYTFVTFEELAKIKENENPAL